LTNLPTKWHATFTLTQQTADWRRA
jgi:hypothetical protein